MKLYDKHIRELLKHEFIKNKDFIGDTSTIIVNEMDVCMGSARIDIAVINGKIHGYEIKSEQDTLERLPSQIESYNKVFDTVNLVLSENHCDKAIDMVPHWWGINCVIKKEKGAYIENIRKPKQNQEIEFFNLSQLLWKAELVELLELHGITKGIKSKTRVGLGTMVVENLEKETLSAFVKGKLKSRESWKALPIQQLCDDLQQ